MTGALLTGVRILDLTGTDTQMCGRILAALGADVVLVEPPLGVDARRNGPFRDGHEGDPEASIAFAALNGGKRSVVVEGARAAEQIARLARDADAIVTSQESAWRDDVNDAALRATGRPVVDVTPFGSGGPYDVLKGPEIVTTALGGLLFFSGDPKGAPCAPPETLGQYFSSVWAALSVVSAVWAARTNNVVARIEVSTQEALATQEHLIRAAAMDGAPITRNGSQHKTVAPARVFRSRDGYVYIYVSQNHWKIFLEAWRPHPPEFDDPKWVPNAVRRKRSFELNAAVEAWTAERPTAEIVTAMQSAGVPCLPVNRPSEFLASPQVRARELAGAVTHPSLGTYEQLRSPALVDGERAQAAIPPRLGEHTALLLATEAVVV